MKAQLLAAALLLAAAPAHAGSLGTLTGTSSTTTTAGTRSLTINGAYASEEHTVGGSAVEVGTTSTGSWDPTAGPSLSVTATGGAGATTSGQATYSTNAVTAGTYADTTGSSFTGTDSSTLTGVFFSY